MDGTTAAAQAAKAPAVEPKASPAAGLGAAAPDVRRAVDARSMRSDLDILNLVVERRITETELANVFKRLIERSPVEASRWMTVMLGRIAALFEISNITSEQFTLDTLLPELSAILKRAFRVDRATVYLYDIGRKELILRIPPQGGRDASEERIAVSASGVHAHAIEKAESVLINDPMADARFDPVQDAGTGFRTLSILCVPMRHADGTMVGIVELLNKAGPKPEAPGRFNADDLALLEAMVRHSAAAIRHAELFAEVEEARHDEAQLLEVTSAISSELELDGLLQKIVRVTTDFLDAERSSLFLYDPKTNQLWSRVAQGAQDIRFPANAGIAGACFTSKQVIHIPDAYADKRFNQEFDRRTGFRTRDILTMPVLNKAGSCIGVMQVLNKKTGQFTPHDQRRLKAFAAQAAITIENAQLFDEVLSVKNYNESILQSLSSGVVTIDNDQKVIKVNAAAARLIDAKEDVLSKGTAQSVFGARNPWVLERLKKLFQTQKPEFVGDYELLQAEGKTISVNLTAVPLIDLKQQPIGAMLVFEDISREKRVKSTMARYMTKEIMEKLLDGSEDALGGVAQEATVLFSDIRSFTSVSEKLGARETVAMLNEYFTEMVEVVFKYHGILDKYIGDAIMAVFGAPFPTPLDANNAVTSATQMLICLRQLNERRRKAGKPPIEIGIGINTGEVIAGNIGSPKRMDYTVIGDTVNLASRLESATKHYGAQLLVTEFTRANLTDDKVMREIDLIRVKGKDIPVPVYEGLDHHTPTSFPNVDKVLALFSDGLALYRERQWDKAKAKFTQALQLNPKDKCAHVYVQRCDFYIAQPPPATWDGVFTMTEK